MEISAFIELYTGAFMAVMGLSAFVQREFWLRLVDRMVQLNASVFSMAMLAFNLGMVIVFLHEGDGSTRSLIVMILGWLALTKGAVLLVWPSAPLSLIPEQDLLKKYLLFIGPAYLALGLWIVTGILF